MSSRDDVNTGGIIAATILALSFAIIAVILRYIARRYQLMATYAEDWFIYLALVCKIGIDIGGIVLLQNGLGRHINTLTRQQLVNFAKTQYAGSFLYPACITFVKLSILSQYRRVFASHSASFKWQINILMAVVVAWGVAIIITAMLLCQPIAKLWNPSLPGTCINLSQFYYGIQIPNILTDLLIIIVPIKEALTLDLTRKLKIGAIIMFLLGTITLCFDIVRLVAMLQLQNHLMDATYHLTEAAIWTTVEPSVAILAVCIPSVRSLTRARRNPTSTHPWHSDRSDATAASVQEYIKPELLQREGMEMVGLEDVSTEGRSGKGKRADVESRAGLMGRPDGVRGTLNVVAQEEREERPAQWPRISLLLDSERPFRRFAEFGDRQRG
ncbi:hypothetical protein LTR95_000217 [Oleoguttula sp. CCFEE 5521]